MGERKERKRVKRLEVTGSLRVDSRIPEWEREIVAAALARVEEGIESLNAKDVRDGSA